MINSLYYNSEAIFLNYFNKTEEDIWCRSQLDALVAVDDRIRISYVLSAASPSAAALPSSPSPSTTTMMVKSGRIRYGRIAAADVARFATKDSDEFATFCCVCGPTPFNDLCLEYLRDAHFDDDNLHIFHG